MQRLQKIHVIVISVLVLVGGVAVWGWRARNGHKWIFRTVPVSRGDLVATIAATGTVEPEEVVDVGAQVAGQIISFGKDKSGSPIDYGSHGSGRTTLARTYDPADAPHLPPAQAQL